MHASPPPVVPVANPPPPVEPVVNPPPPVELVVNPLPPVDVPVANPPPPVEPVVNPPPPVDVPVVRGPYPGNSLQKRIGSFDARFLDLSSQASSEIITRGVSLWDFRQKLVILPHKMKAEHQTFLFECVKDANSIEDIFFHLHMYLSFIDFSLLDHIIYHFGSPPLIDEMKRYVQDMDIFKRNTRVKQVVPYLSGRPEPPPKLYRLKAKLNFDEAEWTLEDVDKHREKLGCEFSLSKFTLFLYSFTDGSIIVTWLMPCEIAPSLKERVKTKNRAVFLKLGILKLAINEEILYPFPTQNPAAEKSEPITSQGSLGTDLPGPSTTFSQGDSILKVDTDLRWVMKAVWEARSKWKYIGRALNVSEDTISVIHESEDGESLTKVIKFWMESSEATVHSLLEALEDKTVSRCDIANEIREQQRIEKEKSELIFSQESLHMDYSHRRLIDMLRRISTFSQASQSDITTKDLQNEFKITDEQIDHPVEDRDVFNISGPSMFWRSHTGMPVLGLSDMD